MILTNDQYYGLSLLNRWYMKYNHQIIDISGTIGTGTWDMVQEFISGNDLDPREIMYLSYNQKQVLELAFKKYHAYYIDGMIYKYTRFVDFNTIPIINSRSRELKYEYKKEVRKKINERYKLIIVLDSVLMNHQTMKDLSSFGLPIILLRDPMLLPSPDTYVFLRNPNIELREIHPSYAKSPIIYFAHKVINMEKLNPGNYDNLTIVPKKQMNLFNLKSSDMNITISKSLRDEINNIYRDKILHKKNLINSINERMIVTHTMYNRKIINGEEKRIKIYLTKGMVGYINRIYKHVETTKYVPIEFRPEFYHESFADLSMDRHYLNNLNIQSHQLIPDEIIKLKYAYALSADMSRLSHWDKVTLVIDPNEEGDTELQQRLIYTAVTRAKKSLTIIF